MITKVSSNIMWLEMPVGQFSYLHSHKIRFIDSFKIRKTQVNFEHMVELRIVFDKQPIFDISVSVSSLSLLSIRFRPNSPLLSLLATC